MYKAQTQTQVTHKITHNIYDTPNGFSHSISIDDNEGLRVGYSEIARNGNFGAIVDLRLNLPKGLFRIEKASGDTQVSNKIPRKHNAPTTIQQ